MQILCLRNQDQAHLITPLSLIPHRYILNLEQVRKYIEKTIYFPLKFRGTFQDRKGSSLYLCFPLLTINNFSWDDFGGWLDRGPYSFWLCNNHFCDGSCGSDDSRFCSCWHCLNSFLPLQRSQSLMVNLMELFSETQFSKKIQLYVYHEINLLLQLHLFDTKYNQMTKNKRTYGFEWKKLPKSTFPLPYLLSSSEGVNKKK